MALLSEGAAYFATKHAHRQTKSDARIGGMVAKAVLRRCLVGLMI
jgi:hypothetical protein